MAYKDDLMDARWQKKRLEIMHRDGFQCLACGEAFALTVHHLYYESGKKPWDYDNECFVTLCDGCHKILHKELHKLGGLIAFRILIGEYDLGLINDFK
jgi:5-methylcytosine-specific restriction endonuclease McrA